MTEFMRSNSVRLAAGLLAGSCVLSACSAKGSGDKQHAIGTQGKVYECTSAKLLAGVISVAVDETSHPYKPIFVDKIIAVAIEPDGSSRTYPHQARSNTAEIAQLERSDASEITVFVNKRDFEHRVPCPTFTP